MPKLTFFYVSWKTEKVILHASFSVATRNNSHGKAIITEQTCAENEETLRFNIQWATSFLNFQNMKSGLIIPETTKTEVKIRMEYSDATLGDLWDNVHIYWAVMFIIPHILMKRPGMWTRSGCACLCLSPSRMNLLLIYLYYLSAQLPDRMCQFPWMYCEAVETRAPSGESKIPSCIPLFASESMSAFTRHCSRPTEDSSNSLRTRAAVTTHSNALRGSIQNGVTALFRNTADWVSESLTLLVSCDVSKFDISKESYRRRSKAESIPLVLDSRQLPCYCYPPRWVHWLCVL